MILHNRFLAGIMKTVTTEILHDYKHFSCEIEFATVPQNSYLGRQCSDQDVVDAKACIPL